MRSRVAFGRASITKSEEKLYTCELEVESTNQFPMIDRKKHYAKQVFNIYVHLCNYEDQLLVFPR